MVQHVLRHLVSCQIAQSLNMRIHATIVNIEDPVRADALPLQFCDIAGLRGMPVDDTLTPQLFRVNIRLTRPQHCIAVLEEIRC